MGIWAVLLVLLALCAADDDTAKGEAWLLTGVVAQGSEVLLLLKVSTSNTSTYDRLNADLGLLLRLPSPSAIAFAGNQYFCKDLVSEVINLPAPKSCTSNRAGTEVRFTFYRDEALRPATDYFLVMPVTLLLADADLLQRTVFIQTYEDYWLVDSFALVLPALSAPVAGPRLAFFEVAVATAAALTPGERFTVLITLAAESDELAVDIGKQESVLIWAFPLSQWDFTSLGPCAVEIGTSAASSSSGTCRFRGFPSTSDPAAGDAFGLNALELSPAERIGSTPRTYRIALLAPAHGGALPEQHRWLAQPFRDGQPSQGLLTSSSGIEVQGKPEATVGHITNSAAGAQNEVVVTFATGLTFSGEGYVRLRLPLGFVVDSASAEVPGFGRVAGLVPSLLVENAGRDVVVELVGTGMVHRSALYALTLQVRNPVLPSMPTACTDALAPLGPGAPGLGPFLSANLGTPPSSTWRLEIIVGLQGQVHQYRDFTGFAILPALRAAVLEPSAYAVGQANTLTVLLRLAVGVLTAGSSIRLRGPEEFRFDCESFAGPAVATTLFPTVETCGESPGLLLLSLKPGGFYRVGAALSFHVDVKNPALPTAELMESRLAASSDPSSAPARQLGEVTAWSIAVENKRVECQAQADMDSPYRTDVWQLFQYPLFVDKIIMAGVAPNTEAVLVLKYRFSVPLPKGTLVTIFAPVGYRWMETFDVQKESSGVEATLPMQLPVIRSGERLHEIGARLRLSARSGIFYGLRAVIRSPSVSPAAMDSVNRWRMQATLPNTTANLVLGGRLMAGSRGGFDITLLEDCVVQASDPTLGLFNEVMISFLLHSSIFTSPESIGRVRIEAPPGFRFPEQCSVRHSAPTLDVPQGKESFFRSLAAQACSGSGAYAVLEVDPSSAIPKGSHVRFRVGVVNPSEVLAAPLNFWSFATTQGSRELEQCGTAAVGFSLLRALERASCFAGSGSGDLRPGMRSVYRVSFVYPVRTAEEDQLAGGVGAQSHIRITVPEGFRTLAACLDGAGDASSDGGSALPEMVSCVGGGRVAEITLASLILPQTPYILSLTVINPPKSFPIAQEEQQWLLQVDNAAQGNIEPPPLNMLRNVRIFPGDTRESSTHLWVRLGFQTASPVPRGGGLTALVPYAFQLPTCDPRNWGFYEAGVDTPLGGPTVADGTQCSLAKSETPGQHHRLSLYPLTAPLIPSRRYLLALLLGNGPFEAKLEGWALETSTAQGSVLDASKMIPSFHIHRELGALAFYPPALPSAAKEFFEVTVTFLFLEPVYRGAMVLYAPPAIQVACAPFDTNTSLPHSTECAIEGQASDEEGQRIVLTARNVWAAEMTYSFKILVQELGEALPVYRRSWRAQLVRGKTAGSSAPDGFVIGARAQDQWQWRGKLSGLAVRSGSPTLGRRSRALLDFAIITGLETPELWVRPPAFIELHSGSCGYRASVGAIPDNVRLVPVPCELIDTPGSCSPSIWLTPPCSDDPPGAGAQTMGFAHRTGLRAFLRPLPKLAFLRFGVDATPQLVAQQNSDGNVWTVSTWSGNVERDVAQAPGFAVRNWIDVARFQPFSLAPEAHTTLAVELWMPATLPAAGHLVVQSPTWRGDVLFDLLPSEKSFDFGNLPRRGGIGSLGTGGEPPKLTVLTNSVDLELCCALEQRTVYHFSFSLQNPPFDRMPSPLLPELNVWSIFTRTASGEVLHQETVHGQRLVRAFRSATVTLDSDRLVGGVGESVGKGQVLVTVDFALPLSTALHGPAPVLRVMAPPGWLFPSVCFLEDVRLGPRTRILGCHAAGRSIQLLVTGDINPGVEGRAFGFAVAAVPPVGAPANDIWVLEAMAHVGSPEGLVGLTLGATAAENEVELRLSSYVPGLPKPGGVKGELHAHVQLSPRVPAALAASWHPPTQFLAEFSLRMPTDLPLGVPNATLRIAGPPMGMRLRCAVPPDVFAHGSLPHNVACTDSLSQDGRVARSMDVLLAVDDLVPLRPGSNYEFVLVGEMEELDYARPPRHSDWPAATVWSIALASNGNPLRPVAAVRALEGPALPAGRLRDLGIQTTSVQSNSLAKVSLLFSISSKIRLPIALEVQPPPEFALDSAPSPLHPALRPLQQGVNPFRHAGWEERARAADEEAERREAAREWPPGVPCPHYHSALSDVYSSTLLPEMDPNISTICDDPPTMEPSFLRACHGDNYYELQKVTSTRCTVLSGKAYIWLYHDPATTRQCLRRPWAGSEYLLPASCSSQAPHEWLNPGQYRITVSGYNPPQTPGNLSRNVWALTVFREAEALGGGPRSLVRPILAAYTPGYEIDANARYAAGLSPEGEGALRGGSLWRDTGSREVPGVTLPKDMPLEPVASGAEPMEAVPTEAVPTKAVPTEAVPTAAAPPVSNLTGR